MNSLPRVARLALPHPAAPRPGLPKTILGATPALWKREAAPAALLLGVLLLVILL